MAEPLLQALGTLKRRLGKVAALTDLTVTEFVAPFLDVIRSEAVAGPITAVALDSVNKFLIYGIVSASSPGLVEGVESIADAVTHARFVGTDLASDEVVLTKILQVLRTLLLVPVGNMLSNEAVCELMQSSFRISCEPRLSELLRRTAEQTLFDMVHKLFSRLAELKVGRGTAAAAAAALMPTLTTDTTDSPLTGSPPKKLPATATAAAAAATAAAAAVPAAAGAAEPASIASIPEEEAADKEPSSGTVTPPPPPPPAASSSAASSPAPGAGGVPRAARSNSVDTMTLAAGAAVAAAMSSPANERFNSRGVRFEPQPEAHAPQHVPYGVPCIRELFRFLVSLTTVRDNPENMIRMGLTLLMVAVETGGGHLHRFPLLMEIAEDSLLRNLFQLLKHESLSLFAAALRVLFLTFESQLHTLKFQLRHFLVLLIKMEYPSYEHKESALDTILQLLCIQSFISDLYVNFDAHLYGAPLLDELVQFLAHNAHTGSGDMPVMSVHLTAIDALLAAINQMSISVPMPEHLCAPGPLPSCADIVEIKRNKLTLAEGA